MEGGVVLTDAGLCERGCPRDSGARKVVAGTPRSPGAFARDGYSPVQARALERVSRDARIARVAHFESSGLTAGAALLNLNTSGDRKSTRLNPVTSRSRMPSSA